MSEFTCWHVWLEWHDLNGASYLYNFGVPDGEYGASSPAQAIEFVLERYVSPRDGRRFSEGRAVRASAAHSEHVSEFALKGINQPEYELDAAL